VHSTPALEAVMDLGGDDDDEKEIEDEEKKTEEKAEEEKDPVPVKTPETTQPENKKRKERIVKVEEKKTIKLQRKPIVIEKEQETIKMEVEEGTVVHSWNNLLCLYYFTQLLLWFHYCLLMYVCELMKLLIIILTFK